MSEMGEGGRYMDDKLYEAAARLHGACIPSFIDVEEDAFRRLTPGDQSNVLHVAARCGNHAFISALTDLHCASLLCKHNSKGETPLHLAAQFGDIETVRTLVDAHDVDHVGNDRKPCWSERDNLGDTPLHKALRYGHEDVALLLLQRDMKALVSLDNHVGESPAYLAVDNFCLNFLQNMLDADRNSQCFVSFSGPFGQTAFHPATKLNEEIMSILIERRKHLLNTKDSQGKTVLHHAVEQKSEAIVETLLKADTSLAYSHDNDGLTPLHRAAGMGLFTMIQTILRLSPQSIDVRDKHQGKTALHVAKMEACFLARCLKKTRMKELVNEVDNSGNTVLHTALMNSDLHSANSLLEVSGINWRLKNKQGLSPMDLCKSEDEIPVKLKCLALRWRGEEVTMRMKKLFSKNIRTVDDLLDHYDWDSCLAYRGPNGDSILHTAARDGHMNIIRRVHQESNSNNCHHLSLSEKNFSGETPLHLAAEQGNLQVVKAIITLCISINRFRNENPHPLAENGEANLLVDDLKPWRMKSGNGDTPAHKALRNTHSNIVLRLLRLDPELASCVNDEDESLLYIAADKRCDDVLIEILKSERYSCSGPDGKNPLHAATRNGGFLSVSSLIEIRPDLINKVDNDGKTPLHHAAGAGRHIIISKLLKEDNASTFIYDNEGLTPLLIAAANGFDLCVITILDLCPQSIHLKDLNNNKTVIHLAKMSSYGLFQCSRRCRNWAKLVNEPDRDGNTPLHSAILDNEKHKALALLELEGINSRIRNKQHQTAMDLYGQLNQNANEEQRLIYKALERLEQKRSFFECWGVRVSKFLGQFFDGVESMRKEELNQLMINIVVVAALLVTITFAALFTIPGGYNQHNGEAMGMKQFAIQVFVAFDVLALFSGIGVLVRYGYSVVFQSMLRRGSLARGSIVLLQLSLVATTIAFMCGLYTIVSHSAIWIFSLAVVAAALYATVPWMILIDMLHNLHVLSRFMDRIWVLLRYV